MDLNNQMILMRKEIKRAKVHVISKLVRRIQNLRNKKGTKAHKVKNSNRAERLVEEIHILKDIKPDVIFKQLLVMNVSANELSNLSLKDRAITRIGLINFIEDKIASIKKQINVFDSERSEKDVITSLEVLKKLPNQRNKDNTVPNNSSKSGSNKSKKESTATATSKSKDMHNNNISPNKNDFNNESKTSKTTEVLDYNSEDNDVEDIGVTAEDEPVQKFTVVLPDYLTKPEITTTNEKTKSNTKNLIDLAEMSTTNDISNILKNYGEGYNSEENEIEKNDSDNLEENSEVDFFFGDKQEIKAFKIKSSKNFKSDDIPLKNFSKVKKNKFETTFVSSLGKTKNKRKTETHENNNDLDISKKRKKNRLGQRARQNLYGSKQETDGRHKKNKPFNNNTKSKTKLETKKFKKEILKSDADLTLHPSWQASQERKKKTGIQEFKGKRITFEDSD